jgi:hypothetical protein
VADENQFLEPPDDLLSTPKHQLMAFLGGPDDAAQATAELVAAGFPRDEIYVMVGGDAAAKIDPTGKHHGLRRRIVRLTQRWTAAGDSIVEVADHVGAGGAIILAPAHGDDEVARAASVLRPHHPTLLRHFGAFTFRDLT